MRGGRGGVKGRAIKEKITFFGTFFCQRSKISTAIKLEGEGAGGYALMGRPFREELFFAASLKFQGKNAYSLTYLLGIRPSVANSTSRRIRKSKCLKAYMVYGFTSIGIRWQGPLIPFKKRVQDNCIKEYYQFYI